MDYSGGIEPVRFSIDDIDFQSSTIFDGLSGGLYTVTAVDANDCEIKEEIQIHNSEFISVDLGEDQLIDAGQSITLNAITNGPIDSVAWPGLINPDCDNCLSQTVAPIITTTYTVYVSNTGGCEDVDSVTFFVNQNSHLYIPNAFSPNEDQVNDLLVVMAGSGVREILEFTIFDRWGNVVFQNENFQPNDPGHGWDGKMNDLAMDPAVFGYLLTVSFEDGREEVWLGNITLVK
jgi:gliding motility-associated-like protein